MGIEHVIWAPFRPIFYTFGITTSYPMEKVLLYNRRLILLTTFGLALLYMVLNLAYASFLNKDVSLLTVFLYSMLGLLAVGSLTGIYYLVTDRRRWWVGVVTLGVGFFILTRFSYLMIYDVLPNFGHTSYNRTPRTYGEFLVLTIPRFYYYSALALVLALVLRYGSSLNAKFKAEQAALLAETQKQAAAMKAEEMELRTWGAYTNPHLFHNELSAVAGELENEGHPAQRQYLARRLQLLADISKYNTENVRNDRRIVVVRQELEQLENYLRSRDVGRPGHLHPVLEVVGEVKAQKIVPMTLVYLAEGAFKHGDLTSEPLVIRIVLRDELIHIRFRNRIPTVPKVRESLGSGLDIVRRRLELALGNGFSFDAAPRGRYFEVVLTIYQS